jgi:hypothetical protein
VSAERLYELARHLTERDREVALYLYRHRVLTTDQLQLLFFSSRRRAQDRLLFLYRNRVLDRFYPARAFGCGKPEAHWLLDEAGAILVAAMHDRERRQLGWQRRDDWGSHPQLAHQLETNRFVTDLIAASLPHPGLGVSEWWLPAEAADHLGQHGRGRVLPDAGFYLTPSRFSATSNSSSASNPTASRRRSSLSGTNRGARSSNSVLLLSHPGSGEGAGLTTERPNHRGE